jgi:hypothetical protein
MKIHIIFILLILCTSVVVSAQEVKVLTLGTFHFGFPNLDIKKIDKENQIDVLAPEYQDEISDIVSRIAEFRPTIIAIEVSPKQQARTDSLYKEYLAGNYALGRSEHEQIGFRLAKLFKLEKLYCTNDWGRLPDAINEVVYGQDSVENQKFMDFFYNNPDSLVFYERAHVFKTDGILEELRQCNNEEHLRKDLGNYLTSIFKYQTEEAPFFGVDFTTGWWFNRNLRIFRNIQRIPTKSGDRILVIYGSGHMNILNLLFDASPEYEFIRINNYLN